MAKAYSQDLRERVIEPIPGTKRWRAQFDIAAGGQQPVELRLFLAEGGRTLSETWLFQHFPELASG